MAEREPLSDEELTDLRKCYAPSTIPPCRVCGAELAMQAVGGGRPTRYACSVAATARPIDWEHYGKSEYENYRRGGDEDVMRLLAEHAALRQALVAVCSTWTDRSQVPNTYKLWAAIDACRKLVKP